MAPAPARAPAPAAPPAAAPAPASGGPSMLGMMGSSMAGSMAGSVIGHGVSKMMFGGGSDGSQQATASPAAAEGMQTAAAGAGAYPCAFVLGQFQTCMKTTTGDDLSACSFPLSQLRECRAQNGQQSEF